MVRTDQGKRRVDRLIGEKTRERQGGPPMQDGQDDLDSSGAVRSESAQTADVYDWLDAAIRATVVAEHGFHNAPPTAAEDDEWPEARDLDDVAGNDEEPAPFTPASAPRISAAHPGDRRDTVPAA